MLKRRRGIIIVIYKMHFILPGGKVLPGRSTDLGRNGSADAESEIREFPVRGSRPLRFQVEET